MTTTQEFTTERTTYIEFPSDQQFAHYRDGIVRKKYDPRMVQLRRVWTYPNGRTIAVLHHATNLGAELRGAAYHLQGKTVELNRELMFLRAQAAQRDQDGLALHRLLDEIDPARGMGIHELEHLICEELGAISRDDFDQLVLKWGTTYTRYIVRGQFAWGAGETRDEAIANYKKAGGLLRKTTRLYWSHFTSDLPFAPFDQEEAGRWEADAYVDQYGNVCWIRCEQHETE